MIEGGWKYAASSVIGEKEAQAVGELRFGRGGRFGGVVLGLGMDADGEQRDCQQKRGDSPEGVHGRSLAGREKGQRTIADSAALRPPRFRSGSLLLRLRQE